MAERKRPRRTRERILETSLALFNRLGAPHVTTADIANEMNISPGNLYYHFRNKDEIIGELYAAYEERMLPLLVLPANRATDVEDLWLLLHLVFEQMWAYRFIYRDLDEIASRNRRIAGRIGELLRRSETTVIELCAGMVATGEMQATPAEIAAVARNVVVVSTYWMSFHRLTDVAFSSESSIDLTAGAYQVLALIAPFLASGPRALFEKLGRDYL